LLDKEHLEMTQKAELFLFSAARTQLVAEVIQPALREGKVVLCDRFYDSTTAYQGFGRGLDINEVKAINKIASHGTTPDLTLFIDVEIEEIIRRRHAANLSVDRMESSGGLFYERVRKGYYSILKEEPGRIILINGMRSIEEIHAEIWNLVRQRLF
jgi:dTMP kinase